MKNKVNGEKERPGQYIDSESPFCRNCTRDDCPTNGDGCKAWETYFMPDYNPDSGKPDKTELKYAYLRGRGYSAEQFTQTYGVTREFTRKADMIAAWVALGYSNEEAQMFYKLYKGKLV